MEISIITILLLAKLGTLLIRALSNLIASRLKGQAARHPRFRSFIINVAHTNHKFSTNFQRRIYGHSTDVAVHPLNEKKALQAATDFIGEIFIFSAGGLAVIFEVQRNVRSEAHKEEARRQELEVLRQRDVDLAHELVLLKQKFDDLEQYARGCDIVGESLCQRQLLHLVITTH